MIDNTVVELSRWQFAATALYHFLFVPLTLGLSFLLAAMETVYVTTGRDIYRRMAQFWGKLFLINFALGVATGLTMEFQFGTNWSFYSSFVGDTFGAPLAIEGLMAFFMESTFVGLMVFGWERMSKAQHLIVTYLVALGSNLSAVWILVANGFMQDPQGARFNPLTMRMELTNFSDLIFNADAQSKFVHTSIAGYVTAAMFVGGISAFYMLKNRHMEIARRSFRMAALFGVLATAGVITLGDALGFIGGQAQPTKLAAMEALWKTEPAPVAFNVVAGPSQSERANLWQIQVPAGLSLLVTHSLDGTVPGVDELEKQAAERIRNGIPAVVALKRLAQDPSDAQAMAQFRAHEKDLGYGFLVQRYAPDQDASKSTPDAIEQAARGTIPPGGADILVVPHHGGPRVADARLLHPRGHLHAAQSGRAPARLPAPRAVVDSRAFHRLRDGLAGGRDRPPAMDRLQRPADLDVAPRRTASPTWFSRSSASSCSTRFSSPSRCI